MMRYRYQDKLKVPYRMKNKLSPLTAACVAFLILALSGTARAQCRDDSDCRGDRICKEGECVFPPPKVECTKDIDCKEDQICERGKCVSLPPKEECTKDIDCRENQICQNGKCVDEKPPVEEPTKDPEKDPEKDPPKEPSDIVSPPEKVDEKPPEDPAEEPSPEPRPVPDEKPVPEDEVEPVLHHVFSRQKGMHIDLGLGTTNCSGLWCRPYSPLFGFNFSVLHRLFPYLAIGGHAAFLFRNRTDYQFDESTVYQTDKITPWAVIAGPEIRAILALDFLKSSFPAIDLWAGAVLGYGVEFIHTRGTSEVSGASWSDTKTVQAFVMGLGLGADYFFLKHLAAGLSAYIYKPFHFAECTRSNIGGHTGTNCARVKRDFISRFGVHWWAGIKITYFFPN